MITRERWQRVKSIFQSAHQCAPSERASFLNQACGGDESIRQEVESLLAADEANEDFLDTPAYELMAGVLTDGKVEFVAGEEVGSYTILSLLGAGGMGQVYLAQDRRLPRKVALKVLSAEVATDERRVQRFEHEAEALARLNHPNVCMILEIGTMQDGRRFIAMEHIDGVTLRDLMERRRLAPAEALDVAIQVAAALAAAHAADIVHRDIKPENIMLRPDGYIKVLDFGIAKLNETLSLPGDRHDTSTARLSTQSGLMGTVLYMSPEQLREVPVDTRTDIWSLGVVLHEMVTGTRPFEAPTASESISLILSQPTESRSARELPAEFQQLIRNALTKDRTERYQTVEELASDLKRVRREFPRQSEIYGTPELTAQQTLNLDPGEGNERPKPNDSNRQTIFFRLKSHAISTADFFLSEIKEHKTTAVFTGITAIFALLLIAPNLPRLSSWLNRSSESRQPSRAQTTEILPMRRITNSGTSVCAAISPDGRSVAHVEETDGRQQLLVYRRANLSDLVVVDADNVEYGGVTFSLDSNYLYFTNRHSQSDSGTLYQVPVSGGSVTKIKDGVSSPITFSPSGDSFAFVRHDVADGEYSLIVARTDGAPERVIATRRNGKRLSVDGPAWSPDGKTIVCGAGGFDHGFRMNLIEVSLADNGERTIGDQTWFGVSQVAWLEDQSGLIIGAREHPMGPGQLWRIPYPQGHAAQITTDPADYRGVSLSRDTIISVQSQRITKIWTAPHGDARGAEAIAPVLGLAFGLSWTASGKIVFSSMTDDHLNISVVDSDGSNQKQLTANAGDNYSPTTSPDGRFIVFSSNRTGSFNIWRMNAEDGSDLKQLTFGDANFYPSCSADSQWVFYDNSSTSRFTVWKVPIDGGAPVQLTDKYARMPVVSPDNQSVACRYKENGAPLGIAIIRVQGGPPLRFLPEIPIKLFQRVEWISNGHALSYIDNVNGVSNIWSYNLNDESKQQLTNFREDQIFAYAWSRDNKQLACQRGAEINDVMSISNQK